MFLLAGNIPRAERIRREGLSFSKGKVGTLILHPCLMSEPVVD
jgi:hypothetical protein